MDREAQPGKDAYPSDRPGVDVNLVDRYIRDAPFPTTRARLVARARDAGAPAEVVAALEDLPKAEYVAPPALFQDLLLDVSFLPGRTPDQAGNTE